MTGSQSVVKEDAYAIQAADLLAWLCGNWFNKYRKEPPESDPVQYMRKDLVAITKSVLPQHRLHARLWPKDLLLRHLKEASYRGYMADVLWPSWSPTLYYQPGKYFFQVNSHSFQPSSGLIICHRNLD
jgi:hypothetical protein